MEEFYSEDRVRFLKNRGKIFIGDFSLHNRNFSRKFSIDTEIYFKNIFLKKYYKFLKPFIYFLYSFTYQKKFIKDSILHMQNIQINYYYNNPLEIGRFDGRLSFMFNLYDSVTFNFLNKIKINDHTKGINTIHIKLLTIYHNINHNQYIALGGIEEDINDGEYEEYATNENKIINSSQTFKSDECVICLTNLSNVLFCNCGHLCLCSECEKLKNSNKCPICKIENRIIRVL